MPEPTAEERLLRGLAELEATWSTSSEAPRSGVATTVPATPQASARQFEPLGRDAAPQTASPHRRVGPLIALVLPAALGLVALALLSGDGASRRGAVGFVAAVLAAPVLPVVGVPLRSGQLLVAGAVAASVVLWLALGWWATRRSTTWSGFALQLSWMVLAVWLGTGLAALGANLILGRPAL